MKKLYSLKVIPKIPAKTVYRYSAKWRFVPGHKQAAQDKYFYGELTNIQSKYYSKVGCELVTSIRMAQRYAKLYNKEIEQITEDPKDGFYVRQRSK